MSDDTHKYPSQLAERFQIRMPDGLRDRLREAADASGRSMNSEIVARLEESFNRGNGTLSPSEEALIDRIRVIIADELSKD